MYVREHLKIVGGFELDFFIIIFLNFASNIFLLQDGTTRLQAAFHDHSGDGLSCIWYVF